MFGVGILELMVILILAMVVVYIRFAGTEAFMGDEEEEPA